MAWRALLCGLALGASVLLPPGVGRPAAALDEVLILSRYRSYTGANMLPRGRGHPGVDFAERLGAPVLAVADGVVSHMIDSAVGCGHGVVIEHAGFARWSAYCHRTCTWSSARFPASHTATVTSTAPRILSPSPPAATTRARPIRVTGW